MNIIFLLYIVLVSKLCFSKPYYSGPGYSNDRDSDSSAMASSHQKKRLLSDDSSQMQEESSIYDTPSRYRKYQSSDESPYMHRDSRLDHDQSDFEIDGKERREYYDSNNGASAKDSSIEVILDPRAKKAVAVVENSPSGQAMYDLSGWKNGADNQDSGEQVVNLVYPAERSSNEKTQRKYNSEGYADSYAGGNSDYSAASLAAKASGMRDSNEQKIKKKRNAEISQNKADTAKVDPVKRSVSPEKRKTESELSKTDEKQNDCPPHNTPQNSDSKNLLKEVKRETQHWSQEQITALHNSVLKANLDSSEMSNLKAMLSQMGLVANTQKRDANEKQVKEAVDDAKREAQTSEFNDGEDLNQDDTTLNRNDRALSDDEKWEMDVNSAPQEPIEKRDLKDDTDKKQLNDNTSNEDVDLDSLSIDSTARKKRQNADKKEEVNAKDAAKLGTSAENSDTLNDKKFNKREAEEGTKKEKRKILEDADYDKQMANQIQAKIDAIKEKVKRDILEDQQKRKRAKRFTNSNSDVEETSNFKPSFRSRRNSNSENSEHDDEKSSYYKANTRKKRANMIQEKQMIYRPFQTDQDEETELDGDFDDNKLYLQKRQAADEDWQYFDSRGRELPPYAQSYYPQSRNRRSYENDYMEDSVPFHDGGMVSNKAALKNREKFRDSFALADQDASNANANEISDSEYFGSLPYSYNGELTRYKRIKRDNPYK